MIGPFDFVTSINNTKTDLLADDPAGINEAVYVPFLVNKTLSYHADVIMFANLMNYRPDMDKKLQYHFLINIVRKRSRYGKWVKPDRDDNLKIVQQYYNYNVTKAKQALTILTDHQVDAIKRNMQQGGLVNEQTN